MPRPPRLPTVDEQAVWQAEARADVPLKVPPRYVPPAPAAKRVMREGPPRVDSFPIANLPEIFSGELSAVDGAVQARLKRGEYPIHARLDMHGMTREKAQRSLAEMITQAYAAGKRCVLVITGKGRMEREAVLKHELPRWLNAPELRPVVLSFTQAATKHGGSGAFYVLLKRIRTPHE